MNKDEMDSVSKDQLKRLADIQRKIDADEELKGENNKLHEEYVPTPSETVYNLEDGTETVFTYDDRGSVVDQIDYRKVEVGRLEELERAAASFRAIQHLYNNGIFWDEVNGHKHFNYCRFGSHLKDMDILESEGEQDD